MRLYKLTAARLENINVPACNKLGPMWICYYWKKRKTVQISCTFLTVVCAQLHWLQTGIDIDAEQLAGANSNVESLCQESASIIRYWESLGLTPARACLFDGTQAAMRFGCSSRPFWLLPVVPDWTDAGEGKPQRMDDWSLEPFFGVQRLDFRTFSLQAMWNSHLYILCVETPSLPKIVEN